MQLRYVEDIYICYDKQRTFVYEADAAHAHYPDRDPY